nr:MAG TPA: hypothetical protein [Caudoviricetes sp.]
MQAHQVTTCTCYKCKGNDVFILHNGMNIKQLTI